MKNTITLKIIFKYFGILTILTLLLNLESCRRDAEESEPNSNVATVVSRFEIVTIDLGSATLSQNEIDGKLGSNNIKLQKTDNSKLAFMVPADQVLGENTLEISSLGIALKYNVKDVFLIDTPENIVLPFKNNLQTFAQTLDTTVESLALKNSFSEFNNNFHNSSQVEKDNFARYYIVNKVIIDDIILNNYNIPKSMRFTKDLQFRLSVEVAVFSAGVFAIALHNYKLKPDLCSWILLGSAVVGTIAFLKAKTYQNDIIAGIFMTQSPEFDGNEGQNDKNSAGILSIKSGISQLVSFKTKNRSVINTDLSSSKERIINYFESQSTYNITLIKVNQWINFVNSVFPSMKIPTYTSLITPDSSPTVIENVDVTNFGYFKLSVTNPKLVLNEANFNSAGKINLKMTINDNSSNINDYLYYTYEDEFRNFTGKLPITVSKTPNLIGKWDFLILCSTTVNWHADVTFKEDGTTIYDEPASPGTYITYGTWSLNGNILSYDFDSSSNSNELQFTGTINNNVMNGTFSYSATNCTSKTWSAVKY